MVGVQRSDVWSPTADLCRVRRADRRRPEHAGHTAEGSPGAAREDRYAMQQTEPVIGEGKAAFKVAVDLDLEGIVAKRLADPYGPRTKWWKVLNPAYSQKKGRADLFEHRH